MTESLSEAECRRLLGCHTLGRVGITNGGLPLIVPVHYVYDDGVIVFRTGAGTKLRTATNGDVLAFEVDAYDTETGRGWSVMVTGRATVLTTGHRNDALSTPEHSPVDEHDRCVRLFCELVTGRVIDKALEH
ncbi:MAG TPA: pyridoxamine 5'-phosphate oxidase family protein [Acidimicrobiia bacterium]|nr:pyridoxamine 5'-phosphate oxidase family protein [Acidimicrobiia bacterium]